MKRLKGLLLNKFHLNKKSKTLVVCVSIGLVLVIIIGKFYIFQSSTKGSDQQTLKSISMVSPDKLKKQNIKEGINRLIPYENKITKAVMNKKKSTENFNDIKKYTSNLVQYKKTVVQDLQQIKSCSCPTEVAVYKENLINEYSSFIEGLDHELNYISSGNNNEMSLAQDNYNNFLKIKDINKKELENVLKLTK